MRMIDIIEKKKKNIELSDEEIKYFIEGISDSSIPKYQTSALLMAIYFNDLTNNEIFSFTKYMIDSGDRIDLSSIHGIKVDKHSSGGVGDTTTIILAPLIASLGIPFAKMSGRGLGHTGGTIDKLESIQGFNTSIDIKDFLKQVNKINACVCGQTKNIAYADKILYALRDVTATVNNMGLIASSIMSKKIASGADKIVLDIKIGNGAFIENFDDGVKLAKIMVDIGEHFNREVICVLTDMSQVLGYAVGNSIEIKEAIDVLKNNGPEDLTELVVVLASYMSKLANKEYTKDDIRNKLKDDSALNKFSEIIKYQTNNKITDYRNIQFNKPKYSCVIKSPKNGYIKSIDTKLIGNVVMKIGGGRQEVNDEIDYSVGLYYYKKIGDYVKAGDVISEVFYNDMEDSYKIINEITKDLLNSFTLTDTFVEKNKLILGVVTNKGIEKF